MTKAKLGFNSKGGLFLRNDAIIDLENGAICIHIELPGFVVTHTNISKSLL